MLACWSADPNRPDSSQWTPIHRGESPPPSPFPSHRSVPPASSAPCLPRAPFRAPHTQRTSRRGFNQGRPAARSRESPVFFDTTEPPDQSRGPPPPSPSRPSLPHSTASLTRPLRAAETPPARRGWPVPARWSADPNRPDSSQWTPIHRGESPPPSPFPSPARCHQRAVRFACLFVERRAPDARATAGLIRALAGFRTLHGPTPPAGAPQALTSAYFDHPTPPQPPPYPTAGGGQQERLRADAATAQRSARTTGGHKSDRFCGSGHSHLSEPVTCRFSRAAPPGPPRVGDQPGFLRCGTELGAQKRLAWCCDCLASALIAVISERSQSSRNTTHVLPIHRRARRGASGWVCRARP